MSWATARPLWGLHNLFSTTLLPGGSSACPEIAMPKGKGQPIVSAVGVALFCATGKSRRLFDQLNVLSYENDFDRCTRSELINYGKFLFSHILRISIFFEDVKIARWIFGKYEHDALLFEIIGKKSQSRYCGLSRSRMLTGVIDSPRF